MGQTSCRYMSHESASAWRQACVVVPNPYVREVAKLNTSASLSYLIPTFILVVMFWLITIYVVPRRDFSRNYLGSVFLPFGLSVLTKLIRAICNVSRGSESLDGALKVFDDYFYNVGGYVFTVGTAFFVGMIIRVATMRKQIREDSAMMPFVIILVVFAIVEGVLLLTDSTKLGKVLTNSLSLVLFGFYIAVGISTWAICCVCCCCSEPRLEQDSSDPVVYDARTRMGWVFVFLCSAPLMSSKGNLAKLLRPSIGPQNIEGFEETMKLAEEFAKVVAPLVALIAVFLFITAYREALFCCGSEAGNSDMTPDVRSYSFPPNQQNQNHQIVWVPDPHGGPPKLMEQYRMMRQV